MSILAKNLRTIRKGLNCTQSVMSEVLKVGFRTYVRYEAGERDAPVSVLVKIARLGNLSLEHLLTKEINPEDLLPVTQLDVQTTKPDIQKVQFETGQIVFSKPRVQGLITTDPMERRILTRFRKMDPESQSECIKNMGKLPKSKSKAGKKPKSVVKKVVTKKKVSTKPVPSKNKSASSSSTVKGKPGRKKLDKKVLKEKIDRLKMITKSIQKITVR